MDYFMVFANPWVITLICIAFGLPLLLAGLRVLRKKLFGEKTKKGNMDAQHVRDVVEKYNRQNSNKK